MCQLAVSIMIIDWLVAVANADKYIKIYGYRLGALLDTLYW